MGRGRAARRGWGRQLKIIDRHCGGTAVASVHGAEQRTGDGRVRVGVAAAADGGHDARFQVGRVQQLEEGVLQGDQDAALAGAPSQTGGRGRGRPRSAARTAGSQPRAPAAQAHGRLEGGPGPSPWRRA